LNTIEDKFSGTLSRWALLAMMLLAGGLMLGHLVGHPVIWVHALVMGIAEGALAAMIVASAGGYGYLIVGKLAPEKTPLALRLVTACVLGLWMFSTALLAVGTAFRGAITGWVWWPVVAVGLLLAGWQGRKRMGGWELPDRVDGRALVWVLIAIVVGIALAGATKAPGWVGGFPDEYDVQEYHLQVPREHYEAGQIRELPHNGYSYYPLGVETLFLLAMALRGGAYEGMYLAKLLHGAFGVLAVAAVFGALKRDDETRGRFGAVLLATTPFVIYCSWLAMAELAEVCTLALALLWLREWLRERSIRAAVMIGAMLGAACAAKYLSVGLIAGPVLIAMLVCAVARRDRFRALSDAAVVAGVSLVLFSPWLIRNVAYTGNPVFPLGTSVFGRGHWSAESEQRWVDGHGPEKKPPVPRPEGWQMPPVPSRAVRFYTNFLTMDLFGAIVKVLAGVAICVLIASARDRRTWDWALVGVLVGQLAVWTLWTHEMPFRFLIPAAVPIALLAAGMLSRLSRVETNPFRKGVAAGPAPWGRVPAVAVLVTAAAVNLLTVYVLYREGALRAPPVHGAAGREITIRRRLERNKVTLPHAARILLIGDAKAFYFPPGTIYATAFDAHPLAEMIDRGLTPEQVLAELRGRGVTHLWVDWFEIGRLARTYGYPASLGAEVHRRWEAKEPPGLEILERLKALGLREIDLSPPASTSQAETAPTTRPEFDAQGRPASWYKPALYALPE
jgi:hypothetical protein